jgi:hypothetical protein
MVFVNLEITTSKLIAFIILLIGILSLVLLHDISLLKICIPVSAGLMGVKTFLAGYFQNNSTNDNTSNNIDQATKNNYHNLDKPDYFKGSQKNIDNPDIG